MKIPYGLTTRYLGLLCSGRELVLGAKLQLALVLVLSHRLLVLATSTSHHNFDRCLQFFGKMLGAALQCLRKGAVAVATCFWLLQQVSVWSGNLAQDLTGQGIGASWRKQIPHLTLHANVPTRGGNRLHSELPSECEYLQSTRVYGD